MEGGKDKHEDKDKHEEKDRGLYSNMMHGGGYGYSPHGYGYPPQGYPPGVPYPSHGAYPTPPIAYPPHYGYPPSGGYPPTGYHGYGGSHGGGHMAPWLAGGAGVAARAYGAHQLSHGGHGGYGGHMGYGGYGGHGHHHGGHGHHGHGYGHYHGGHGYGHHGHHHHHHGKHGRWSVGGSIGKRLMKNIWNHVKSSPFDALKTKLESYVHQGTGMGLHIANIPGPLCSCMIVVPTETQNNMGLPHTLEHLVFLGSKNIPYRGYLDIFANRCLATGTNAYTAEDHTCFNVSTAGFEGMLNILPVFLDYVLHPELSDSNFHTEIYHVDGDGRELGVVYCEMLGRENTEEDLKDHSMNKLLYEGSGYASYTGGKTTDIAKLTNEMIREFHKQHYSPSRISVVLLGQIDPALVFEALDRVDLSEPTSVNSNSKSDDTKMVDVAPVAWSNPIPVLRENRSEIVRFPSEDENVGSVSFGWQGPPITDVYTSVALHVLFRYLQETAASPIQQRFVERSNPLASGVDFGVRNYKISQLVLELDGIPLKWSKSENATEDEEESGSESDGSGSGSGSGSESGSGSGSEESDSEGSGSESESEDVADPETTGDFEENLLAPNSMYKRLESLLRKQVDEGFANLDVMQKAVRRHKVKFMESLEDDPQDYLSELLIPDILFTKTDIGKEGESFGRWFKMANILDDLEKKDQSFWLGLIKKWLLDTPHVEIIMIPDKQLAKDMTEQGQKNVQQRIADIGADGLILLKDKLKKCVEENSTPLPENLVKFPLIPSEEKIPILPVSQKLVAPTNNQAFPVQTCELQTLFYHVRLIFHIKDLPNELRPYLALFQELLFETDLQISQNERIPYTDAVKVMSEELVSIECGVGFGSSAFACDMLSEVFYVYGISQLSKLDTLCKWINKVLFGAVFPAKRILTMASNLLSDAHEESRDGQSVAATLCNGIIDFDMWHKDKSSNNVAISILKQIPFLQQLKEDLKSGDPEKINKITQSFYRVKEFLWSNNSRIFAQLSFPTGSPNPVNTFFNSWNSFSKNSNFYTTLGQPSSNGKKTNKKKNDKKAKKNKAVGPVTKHFMTPFERVVARGLESPKHVMAPIGGVESSFIYQIVNCPVDKKHPDCLPILVLGEMISLTEGPLYTKIRGKGYAYDASLSFHLWSYALSLNLHECSSPVHALEEFHQILRSIPDPSPSSPSSSSPSSSSSSSSASPFLTDFSMDTAKASLLYQFHSGRANPSAVVAGSLRALLKGFSDIDEERLYEKKLNEVTKEDVLRVYHAYFEQFLEPSKCTLVITCNPGSSAELTAAFAKPPFNITLSVCEIKDLLLH